MPPRDFSEDGAVGAGSGFNPDFGNGGAQEGAQTGGKSVSDFGGVNNDFSGDDWSKGSKNYNAAWGTPEGTPDLSYTAYGLQDAQGNYYDTTTGTKLTKTGAGYTDPTRATDLQNRASAQTASRAAGVDPTKGFTPMVFAQGGAIPDDDNDYDGTGSPAQELIQKALSTVDGVLAFGRRLHGLGGGDNEGIKTSQDDEAGSAGSPGQKRFQDGSMSPNIEDRRGENPPGAVGGAVSNFVGKAYDLYDRAANPDNPIDQTNPIAKDLGGDDLSQPPKGAIDTDEDQ